MISLTEYLIRETKEIKFKDENIKALYDYAYGYTNDLNYRFRKGKPTKQDKENADKLIKLAKDIKLPTLYRSAEWRHFTQDYKIKKENIKDYIGKTIVDPGFLSTSDNEDGAWQLNVKDKDSLLFIFKSEGKHKAIDVNKELGKYSPSPEQTEYLLNKDTEFRIDDVKEDNKGNITLMCTLC